MTNRSKFFVILGALVLAAPLVSGCSAPGSSGGDSKIVIAQAAEVTSLQPDIETQRSSQRIWNEIFEAPTTYAWDGTTYELTPKLAEKWEQTGPTTWLFTLRDGVEFSDGTPLKASDVEATYNAYVENKRGGAFVMNGLSVKAVSDLEFEVTTTVADLATVPAQLSFLYVYPADYYNESGPDKFGSAPIGTGPYKLDKWTRGVSINLVVNEAYWGDEPSIEHLEYKTVPDNSTRVSLLQSGGADVVADLPPELADRVEGISGARLEEQASQRRVFIYQNAVDGPTSSELVRQAINYAVDADSIVKNIFNGRAYPLRGIFTPGEIGYQEDYKPYDYDPDKARELLAEAGYPDGVEIEMLYDINAIVLDSETAQAVQAQLSEVGITLKMNGGPSTSNSPKRTTNPAPTGIGVFSFGPIYNDSNFLINGASFSSTSLFGSLYVQDPKVDELAQQGLTTTDPDAREQIYEDLQSYIMEQGYWAPLYQLQDLYGVTDSLDWSPQPNQNFLFEFASLN